MSILILPVHRRLAELHIKSKKLGGFNRLPVWEQMETFHCLVVNADLVQKLDGLKELAYQAHVAGDMEWQQDICKQIEEIELSCR